MVVLKERQGTQAQVTKFLRESIILPKSAKTYFLMNKMNSITIILKKDPKNDFATFAFYDRNIMVGQERQTMHTSNNDQMVNNKLYLENLADWTFEVDKI